MDTPRFVEETVKEKKLVEVDACKVPVCSCTNHSTKGLEDCCKSGAFLVPLCVVI